MMGRIYTIYGKLFLAIGCIMLLVSGYARAQGVPFLVTGQCMANPDCQADSTMFSDTLTAAVAWQWNFGDVTDNTSTRKNPGHSYLTPGSYTVTLVRTLSDGSTETVSQVVTIGQLPPSFQNWKADTTICPGQKITLDPYPQGAPAGAKYIWFPKGDTTQTLEIDSSGCYSVEVILPNGCKIQDKVNVKVCLEPTNQEGAKWYFGANAGLDFSGGSPEPLTDGKVNTPEGVSTMSNSKGELLFYSDGITIYDRNGNKMECLAQNCAPLKGSPNSTQSVLIVPQPTCRGCEYLFNVFTTSDINGEKLLSVSTVDMRRNNGNGAIVELNTTLSKSTTERLVSSRNDKDTTYWVIAHEYGSNKFQVFHATTGGLNEAGTYELGMSHDTTTKAQGYMKFSSADSTGQRRLAVVVGGPPTNYVELFYFNDETGVLTYDRTINLGPAPPTAYGVEFSPSGEKMYVSYQGDGTAKSYLAQYNLTSGDSLQIAQSRILIDSSSTQKFGALQIGPDGRIYMAVEGSSYLAVIGEPEQESVLLMEYERNGINLGGKKSALGLPNLVQNFTQPPDGPGFSAEGFCTNEPTLFQASPLCDPIEDTYFWNFGDGSTASGKETEQQHVYTQPGIYTVTLRASNQCKDTTFTKQVEIFETPPPFSLGPDQDVCRNFLKLEIGVRAQKYVWVYNGRIVGRDSVYNATLTGRYIAFAFNGPEGQECVQSDTLELTIRKPPAFSLGPDTTMCNDSSIVLTAPGLTWREFKWSTGETTRDITVREPGIYYVEVKNGNDCYNEDTIAVVERPRARLIADLLGPTTCTSADGAIRITSIDPPGGYNYAWTDIDSAALGTANPLTGLREGVYFLRVSGNPLACTTDTSFALRSAANPLQMTPIIKDAACTQPDSGAIGLNITGGTPNRFTWRNSSGQVIGTGASIDNLSKGIYSLEASDAGGCTFTITGIVVELERDNLADLGPDRLKCDGDTIHLTPLSVDFPANEYLWGDGSTDRTLIVRENGVYKLTARNTVNGCSGSDEIAVGTAPAPVLDMPEAYEVCAGDGSFVVELDARGRGNLKYLWPVSGDTTQTIQVSQLGIYQVIGTNELGCITEQATEVVDRCEPRLFIPSAITPNGDGKNDKLEVFGKYFNNYSIKIYSRWGEVIFASDSIENKWDGSYRGLKVQPGVYAYVVTYGSVYYPERPLKVIRGAVTVIK